VQYDGNRGTYRQMRQDFPIICTNICLNSNKYNIYSRFIYTSKNN